MGRSADIGRGPLISRRRGEGIAGPPVDDWAGRPCWVLLDAGQHPGHIYAWRKSPSGEAWEGLLVAWVTAEVVRPR
jgi:hypothetical protein